MKLYYSPGACSLASHIVVHEAGLPCTPVLASTKTHQLEDGTDFYTINPLGYVPVLELDDGTRLREGPAILQYLADQVPHKNLAPANGTLARYQLQEWLCFIGTEVHKNFGPLFRPATPEECKPAARENILKRLQWLDANVLAQQTFLMGDIFTVADAYLFTTTNWPKLVGPDIADLPNLAAYRERIAARPAVQAAMKAEGMLK